MLNEKTLFGEHNKIEVSLARIREWVRFLALE
jgi:hypothetical protein